jgi:hypothetical protein
MFQAFKKQEHAMGHDNSRTISRPVPVDWTIAAIFRERRMSLFGENGSRRLNVD